jgi:hypothetical protein
MQQEKATTLQSILTNEPINLDELTRYLDAHKAELIGEDKTLNTGSELYTCTDSLKRNIPDMLNPQRQTFSNGFSPETPALIIIINWIYNNTDDSQNGSDPTAQHEKYHNVINWLSISHRDSKAEKDKENMREGIKSVIGQRAPAAVFPTLERIVKNDGRPHGAEGVASYAQEPMVIDDGCSDCEEGTTAYVPMDDDESKSSGADDADPPRRHSPARRFASRAFQEIKGRSKKILTKLEDLTKKTNQRSSPLLEEASVSEEAATDEPAGYYSMDDGHAANSGLPSIEARDQSPFPTSPGAADSAEARKKINAKEGDAYHLMDDDSAGVGLSSTRSKKQPPLFSTRPDAADRAAAREKLKAKGGAALRKAAKTLTNGAKMAAALRPRKMPKHGCLTQALLDDDPDAAAVATAADNPIHCGGGCYNFK